MNPDVQHLKILSIFHYILGGLLLGIASIPLIHFGLGIMMVFAPGSMAKGGSPPPAFLGWIFMLVAGAIIVLGWSLAISLLLAGRFLSQRKHRTFCLVVACVSMIYQPFGTVLGVFTLVVLIRPSVKRMFETGETPYDPDEDDAIAPSHDDQITFGSYNIHSER